MEQKRGVFTLLAPSVLLQMQAELGGNEAMTCQELLALSGALSAALPTGQLALDSFLNSLTKGKYASRESSRADRGFPKDVIESERNDVSSIFENLRQTCLETCQAQSQTLFVKCLSVSTRSRHHRYTLAISIL